MMLLGCVASQTAGDVPATGYPLDDDGTNAASFNAVLLPTQSPAYNRALYQLTATEQTAVAMPAVIDAAPGLVALTDGAPRVCGFIINAVPAPGTIRGFVFQIYNLGGSGSVLVHASVAKDADATTGTVQGQAGSFNGISSFAAIPINLSSTSALTIAFWLNWTTNGANDKLAMEFTSNYNSSTGGFIIDPNGALNRWRVALNTSSSSSVSTVASLSSGAFVCSFVSILF